MNETNIIEGEVIDQQVAISKHKDAGAGAIIAFNPLDADPGAFTRQLSTRQDNYDALREHLFGILVPGKDFGKIHVAKSCDNKYNCTNNFHFSGNTLFAPGADKILGILSLGVQYPDLRDYKQAALGGKPITDIIIDAQIFGTNDQIISSGVGACSRSEINGGNLNVTIKRACKRARLDAVTRLPSISALFESDILEELAATAARNNNNAATNRTKVHSKKWDTGVVLDVCPIGKDIKNKPWREIDTNALQWLVNNISDKPDIFRAAERELSRRNTAEDPGTIQPADSKNDEPPEYSEDEIPH